MTICVIGASGKLGNKLMNFPNTIACPVRFENAVDYGTWFDSHPEVDTIWHVARACRKLGIRRDYNTYRLEKTAMQKLMQTRARFCRFVYASTKTVYGVTTEKTPLSAETTANEFTDKAQGIVNFPIWKTNDKPNIAGLGSQHRIYAITKLVCERLVMKHCNDFKIIRLWDII
tara:strand:+ start:427 stop:945 length:519 start_codon:yes stop_codon:yes gene_type:complete